MCKIIRVDVVGEVVGSTDQWYGWGHVKGVGWSSLCDGLGQPLVRLTATKLSHTERDHQVDEEGQDQVGTCHRM